MGEGGEKSRGSKELSGLSMEQAVEYCAEGSRSRPVEGGRHGGRKC